MVTDPELDPEIMAARGIDKKIPAEVAQEILHAVASIAYGSVEVVVQIE